MATDSVVKSIQDIMRQDVGVDGDAQRISQMGWMIFLKLFDASDRELELIRDNYESPIPEDLRWRNWAADEEGVTGDDLLQFIDETLFPALSDLEVDEDNRRGLIVRSVFEDSYNYMKSGTLLRKVINKLEEIDFTSQEERHVFNDVYEKILRDLQSAGNAAEYYTPRPVTRFMAEQVDPELGEKVLDPACGTGGFLVDTIEHLRRKGVDSVQERDQLQRTIQGIEKKPLPYMLAMANLILHDIEAPKLKRDNSLAQPLRQYGPSDKVDVILTNPPFGGKEPDGIERNFPQEYRTRETADLFLALAFKRLKPGGRCAIVLPDGFLFGEGVKTRLKETLLEEHDLHTIVRMPKGVFAPYTNINTNLLFFEKGPSTDEVWYFEHPLPEGYKQYTKTKPLQFDEFELEQEWWDDRENEKFDEYAWKVPVEEIEDRDYNLDIDNPHEDDEEITDPDELLARYEALQEEINATRQSLKDELESALQKTLA
ncbi:MULTISPECIES: type I restriction-modification system subunit M [Salinibacter]|uniref:type I restriction-modification system subunit M n=1 Tax=Salinibacter TaxID=146918 RepID=UPI0021E737C6|nr:MULTISPECIES: class I SAM-dependent DNA methyltransferase [Salinibacter]